ncbi:BLUF domain-containing protein [Leucobacter sp. HY1910]
MNRNDTVTSGQLFALMYSSDAVSGVDEATLDDILHTARRKNTIRGITGILLFRQGKFFQYIEGPERSIKDLYREICADSRHTNLRVLLETPVHERRFSEWTMGHEALRQSAGATPAGYRSTFADLEDTERPENVLRAVIELTHWYRARAARALRASVEV